MPRAPKVRKLNTIHCSICDTLVKYKTDVARHNRIHDENREGLMVYCTYPGCDYGSLQKSNTVNHTRKHGFSKSWACPFPNCTYFTLYSRFLTQHLLDAHNHVRTPRGKVPKQSKRTKAHSSTTPSQGGLEQRGDQSSAASSSQQDVAGLTYSSDPKDQQRSIQPMMAEEPAPLVPGYQFPFFPNTSSNPSMVGNMGPSYHNDMNTMYHTQIPSQLTVPSRMSLVPQVSRSYFTQGQGPQIYAQQQTLMPMTPFMHFESAFSALSSPLSSSSSSSFPDNGYDLLAEIHRPLTPLSIDDLRLDMFYGTGYSNSPSSASGSSTTWENLSLTPAVDPSFITNCMQNASAPYIGEANIMSASTDSFVDIGNAGQMSTSFGGDFDFDFSHLFP